MILRRQLLALELVNANMLSFIRSPLQVMASWFYFSVQWFPLFSLRGIKSCGEWKCSNYVVVNVFLRSQLSSLNLLCVDDHILNSFLFLIYQQGVQVRESHASVKIMASVANVRLQRIWNKDWSKTKKQNNEKLSLRMADKLLSFNYNNSKCKRNTTQQKAQEMG